MSDVPEVQISAAVDFTAAYKVSDACLALTML